MYPYKLGDNLLERSFVEEDHDVLVNNRLTMNRHCAPVSRKASGILMCMRKMKVSRLKEVTIKGKFKF